MVAFCSTIVYLAMCYAVGCYAEEKNRSKWFWILISFFTSPLLAFIILWFLGRK